MIEALKSAGWEFACNGYDGTNYGSDEEPYLRILQNGTKVWEHLWETPRFCCFRPVQTAVDGKHMMSRIRYIRY